MRCPSCGKENSDHFKFCLGCGTTLEAPEPAETRPAISESRIAALLAEADDYERFEMWAEAAACIQKALNLASERGDLKERLENLRARRSS